MSLSKLYCADLDSVKFIFSSLSSSFCEPDQLCILDSNTGKSQEDSTANRRCMLDAGTSECVASKQEDCSSISDRHQHLSVKMMSPCRERDASTSSTVASGTPVQYRV